MHSQKPLLTVSFTSGDISLMNNYDDLSPTLIRTGLKGVWVTNYQCRPNCSRNFVSFFFFFVSVTELFMAICGLVHCFIYMSSCAVDVVVQWCSQGDLLAVAGMERTLLSPDPSCPPPTRNAIVKFYNVRGEHIYTLDTPAQVIICNRLKSGYTTIHKLLNK